MCESAIYLQQAVTMLRTETEPGRDRWLDWVLALLLNPETDVEKINSNLRKELFSILSTAFLQEIHRVSEIHSTEDCSDHLISYLVKGNPGTNPALLD